ncbi:isoamyl acetate-hydrolyzing esterase 1 homolog isoform X2 [Ptychodera flava]|uniref:isoamyl acetate-hydrolyzing esterase 1 homolog isoform X2 n=1 Tax=Ptychodera flava TaxID=63121 RepID=UPI00396A06F6
MWPLVILYGDSLTQRSFGEGHWGAALADKLQRKCDVLSRGFAGYNSSWCSHILPQIITKEMADNVALVTLFFGTNDSVFEGFLQHVSLDKFKQNMKDMIHYLNSIGIGNEKIIIISPPMVNETAWDDECKRSLGHPKNKTNELTVKYADVCCSITKTTNIALIDLFHLMSSQQNWERFLLPDGIHLSVEGSKLLDQHLADVVSEKTGHLPMKFPLWREVDGMNIEKSLVE